MLLYSAFLPLSAPSWNSAKLKIWQVSACKMGPQSGITIVRTRPAGRPAGRPTDHPTTSMSKRKERPQYYVCPHLLCLSPPFMYVPTFHICPHLLCLSHFLCLSPPIMSVPIYYVCLHLLFVVPTYSLLSPLIICCPTYYVCPHP